MASSKKERARNYSRALKLLMLERAFHKCHYCGNSLELTNSTIDHIDPMGADDNSNYAISCNSCNSAKGDKSLDDFRTYLEARYLIEMLPKFNWSTNQLIWLASQEWFPYKAPCHKFYFEKISLS